MKELASLHDQHLNRPTLDDSSEQEHAIEITAQEITQVRVGLGPQAGVGSSRPLRGPRAWHSSQIAPPSPRVTLPSPQPTKRLETPGSPRLSACVLDEWGLFPQLLIPATVS